MSDAEIDESRRGVVLARIGGRRKFGPARGVSCSRRRSLGRSVLFGLGLTVIQAIWASVIGPLGGFDEPQHYYRAVSIVNGTYLGPTISGVSDAFRVVEVPGRQFPGCVDNAYTCPLSTPPLGGPDVPFASSAGVYPPGYYGLVGAFALPWDWPASLLAARWATAILIGALAVACHWTAKQVWPRGGNGLALLAVATPATVFLGSTVTPSGVEIWAAAGTTIGGFATVRELAAGRTAPRPWRIVLGGMGAVLLLTRPMSPLVMLGIVVVTTLYACRLRQVPLVAWAMVRHHPIVLAVLAFSGTLAAAWSVPTWPNDPSANSSPLPAGSAELMVYFRKAMWSQWQAMVGVPNDWIVSPLAHLLLTVVVLGVLGVAALGASRRALVVLGLVAVATLLVGIPANWLAGFGWYQGRYALPGLALLLVLAGDQIESGDGPPAFAAFTVARLRRALAGFWVAAQVLYAVEFFGVAGAERIIGVDAWRFSFVAKIDVVPDLLGGVIMVLGLCVAAFTVAATAVGVRRPMSSTSQ